MQRFVAMGCQVVHCRGCRISSLVLVIYVVDFFWYWFWLGDAYHITQPPSDGRGAILAMTHALRQVSSNDPIMYFYLLCIIWGFLLAELPTVHVYVVTLHVLKVWPSLSIPPPSLLLCVFYMYWHITYKCRDTIFFSLSLSLWDQSSSHFTEWEVLLCHSNKCPHRIAKAVLESVYVRC